MDPQARVTIPPDPSRRLFLLAGAVAAASFVSGCEQPQGMRRTSSSSSSSSQGGGAVGGARRAADDPASASGASSGAKPASESQGSDPNARPKPVEGGAKPAPVERPAPPSSEPAIRIRSGSLPKSNPKVSVRGPGPGLWIIEPGSGRPGTVAQSPVEFTLTATGWRAVEGAGTSAARVLAVPAAATLEIMALRGEPQWLELRGTRWPGKVRLVPQPEDLESPVDVVHEVPMEEYLPGVLARELFNGWKAATHEAQAIAARSYALCEMAAWKGRRHFDVVAGEQSQAWIGMTAHRRSLDAVAATRGQVLLFAGRVVPAYYSSCCGGARASASDAISDSIVHDIAPLEVSAADRGDCCSAAPTYRWQSRVDANAFARTLPAWARAEGFASLVRAEGLRSIEVSARNPAGRPVRFVVTDARGNAFEMPAERLRWAFNADPANPADLRPAKERVKSAFFEPAMRGGEIVLSGRGHGHGAGMCQYGAEAMAKRGSGASAILARYYPGASIDRTYA